MEELLKQAQDELYVRIYGTQSLDFPKVEAEILQDLGHTQGNVKLIRVTAIGYGMQEENCTSVTPFYLIVTGEAKPAKCGSSDFPSETKMWVLKKSVISTRLDAYSGTIEELISEDEEEIKGLIDVKVEPSLSIKVKDRGNGKVCVDYTGSVNVYYKSSLKSRKKKWKKLFGTSIGGSECITDNACVTILKAEFVTAKLCYYPNGNKVCLEAKAGYMGVGATAKVCQPL